MTQARKLLRECCERCTEWSSADACEDHITCPVFQLYRFGYGNPEWGAPKDEQVFIIKLKPQERR